MYLGGICFITDRNSCDLDWVDMTKVVLSAGVKWVQYRDKESDRCCLFETATELRELTLNSEAFFIMNDHPDIAAAVGADGVHLGQDDMPVAEARKVLGDGKVIGVSTHTIKEAMAAQKDGADYIGFGPVFSTRTKDAGAPIGTEMIAEVRRNVDIPVVAIGGITPKELSGLVDAGAQAVAVASGILKGEIRDNIRKYISVFH
jgi:thiamine-phosphate pyrophosphorylase